ncbi:hypothetical protein ASPBRDRAFT_37553 [Aspergillus brasiliensis CBS 101740]|uniref:Uncharacterized protein n=1 Tax=Aspergillus brasiliensis (strain CBS 101740 / IMI 381727 / IBT 21946) TaxID=767769 RepID=A0A1L9V338_ASPBC|nr:hypothetical protein ASPBRDRAFT_37553 [Aspergillus brasiliensis CBS 101740]
MVGETHRGLITSEDEQEEEGGIGLKEKRKRERRREKEREVSGREERREESPAPPSTRIYRLLPTDYSAYLSSLPLVRRPSATVAPHPPSFPSIVIISQYSRTF